MRNLRRIRLTKQKVHDQALYKINPFGFNEGYSTEGYTSSVPKVGKPFVLDSFHTSTVVEVIDDNTFKTINSIYKIETLPDIEIRINT